MKQRTVSTSLTAACAALALTLSACGGSSSSASSGDGVASLGTVAPADTTTAAGESEIPGVAETSADGSAGAGASADPEAAFAEYSKCLDDLGIDVDIFVGGREGGDGAAVEFSDESSAPEEDILTEEQFEQMAECDSLLQNIDNGFDLSPEQEAAVRDAELEWARCMREQGQDVPDPSGDANGAIEIGEEIDFEAFEAAANTCDSVFDDAFGDESDLGGDDEV